MGLAANPKQNQKSKVKNKNDKSTQKCSIRLQSRARVELYDLKRSHYDCVCNLANEIATPQQVGARNDTLFCHCEERSDEAISSTNYLP